MSRDGYYNGSHCPDPTAYKAIKNTDTDERLKKVIRELKTLIEYRGFELVGRVVLRDKETGRIYK